MLSQSIASFRRFVLDRLVLRPSRNDIPVATQERVMLDTAGGQLETLVHRSRVADGVAPDFIVLKFPGTAGRAERSSRFPVDLLSATTDSFSSDRADQGIFGRRVDVESSRLWS